MIKLAKTQAWLQRQVFEVVQKILDHITDALAVGETVELRNFGILEVKLSKPRVGRNPNQPGSHFAIPPTARVKFKSGKNMRQKVAKLSATMKRDSGAV